MSDLTIEIGVSTYSDTAQTALTNYDLGILYLQRNNCKQALACFLSTYADKSDPNYLLACCKIMQMYLYGIGVESSQQQTESYAGVIRKNIAWFIQQAERGNKDAQFHLVDLYLHGIGVEQNFKQAIAWCMVAAKQDHVVAKLYLGIMYRDGYGVISDYRSSYYWFEQAAKQGSVVGKLNLYQAARTLKLQGRTLATIGLDQMPDNNAHNEEVMLQQQLPINELRQRRRNQVW